MPTRKTTTQTSRRSSSRKTSRRASSSTRVAINGDVKCADFVGRDKITTTYGYTAADVGHLIDIVLAFLQAGATFVPRGETLTFHPGAVKQLIGRRDLKSYLLALTVHREYQIWATKFIPLAAQMDVKRLAVEKARKCRRIPPVRCTLCYTPSDTLHYKTHVSIYVLPAGLPAG